MDKERRGFIKKSLLICAGFNFIHAKDIFNDTELKRELNSIPAKLFGILGDGISDETDSINLAIQYLSDRGGGELIFDEGIYLINKFEYIDVLGLMPTGINFKKNVKIVGSGNNTIFKLGSSTNGKPFILFNCYLQENCGISNFSIDGNQINNRSLQTDLKSPRTIVRVAASMCFSMSNINIYNADVNNYVYIGQNVNTDYNNTITNCNFTVSANNGHNYDHSTIYLASVGTVMYGCKVQAIPILLNKATRELMQSSGIEIHASNIKILNNIVSGYNYIGYISSQEMILNNILIQGNFLSSANGFAWAGSKNAVSNLRIIDNKIEMFQPVISNNFGQCAIVRYPKVAISSIYITNNVFFVKCAKNPKMSLLFLIHNSGDSILMKDITINNNKIQTNQSVFMVFDGCILEKFQILHNEISILNKGLGIGVFHFAMPSFSHGQISNNYYDIINGETDFYVLMYMNNSQKYITYQYNTSSSNLVPKLEFFFNVLSSDVTSTYSIDSFVKFQSMPPISGIWLKGQKVYNNYKTDNRILGWLCIDNGNPGTWVSF